MVSIALAQTSSLGMPVRAERASRIFSHISVRRIPGIARIAHCGADEIEIDTALADIKADSLHWVQTIIAAEELFNIEIDIEKMKEFTTIRDLVSYIDGLRS